jgi:hypothetical protein
MATERKRKPSTRSAGDLTTVEIKQIVDELVALREKLRLNGATALTPTPEWSALRKEIALLNKSLNADAAAKLDARAAPSEEANYEAALPGDSSEMDDNTVE